MLCLLTIVVFFSEMVVTFGQCLSELSWGHIILRCSNTLDNGYYTEILTQHPSLRLGR